MRAKSLSRTRYDRKSFAESIPRSRLARLSNAGMHYVAVRSLYELREYSIYRCIHESHNAKSAMEVETGVQKIWIAEG